MDNDELTEAMQYHIQELYRLEMLRNTQSTEITELLSEIEDKLDKTS